MIVQDGIRRMYQEGEDRFYYIMMYNEDYPMPEMPEGVEEGIIKGIYKFKAAEGKKAADVHLFGSGPILNEALQSTANPGGEIRRKSRCMERNQL